MRSKANGNGHTNGHDLQNGNGNGNVNGNGAGRPARPRKVLITGGAGFIGTNLAHRLAGQGRRVLLYDNLSRAGVAANVAWLRAQHGERVELVEADTRDAATLREAVAQAGEVFHFAAQVAVTTSLADPYEDLAINVLGTFNLLEALRAQRHPPALVFTSTNKVYGGLADLRFREDATRYVPADAAVARHGIGESRPLDFHSPYGCSKGAADQYVLDYARIYGLRTVVFRMSCIYGPHQFGTEDQGWIAHFLIRALAGQPITLYGDGKQVRDVLFVEDLVEAFLLAQANAGRLAGQAFNIGGGPANTISLMELMGLIEELDGQAPPLRRGLWRPGDQKYYVSDTARFARATGWKARVGVREGVERLHHWLREARAERLAARPAAPGSGAATLKRCA